MKLKKIILILTALFFLFPSFAFGAAVFDRIPIGNPTYSPLTFTSTANSQADYGAFQYPFIRFGIQVGDIVYNSGVCLPYSNSLQGTVSVPNGYVNSDGVRLLGYNNDFCGNLQDNYFFFHSPFSIEEQPPPPTCTDEIMNQDETGIDTGGVCAPPPPASQCSNNIDDDLDGNTDFPSDLGCIDANDDDETGPVVTPPRGGGGSRRPPVSEPPVSEGLVLGATVGPETCGIYLNEYIKLGAKNNPFEVTKLQLFLNLHMGANLPLTGFYGPLTFAAVKRFQVLYTDEVLESWLKAGIARDNNPSGWVYKTTKRWINVLMCPELKATTPIPPLL